MKITQDDLLEALRDAFVAVPPGEGFTGPELMARLGQTWMTVKAGLQHLAAEGRLEIVQVKRTAIDGRAMTLRAYQIKPKAKK